MTSVSMNYIQNYRDLQPSDWPQRINIQSVNENITRKRNRVVTGEHTWECRAMAFPLSWLKRFLPIRFLVTTTIGANKPFPSLTFFIMGWHRTAFPTRMPIGTAFTSMPFSSPHKAECPGLPPHSEEDRPAALREAAMKADKLQHQSCSWTGSSS